MSDDDGKFDRASVWATRDTFSGKASEIVRQLGFAGIALVWLFRREGDGGTVVLPSELRAPAFLVVGALTFDLLQYVWGSAAWGVFGRFKERKILNEGEEDHFFAPRWINYPTNAFFWGKIVLIITAYVLIGRFLAKTIV